MSEKPVGEAPEQGIEGDIAIIKGFITGLQPVLLEDLALSGNDEWGKHGIDPR